MLSHTLARFSNGRRYCTGSLISADTILTCAHFFRAEPHNTYVWLHGRRFVAKDLHIFEGTDVAVVTLPTRMSLDDEHLPAIGPTPQPWAQTATLGFGGTDRRRDSYRIRRGRFLWPVPYMVSRDWKTHVRHGGQVFNVNAAVKGDSGGPVYVDGKIVGVQSMIMNPLGIDTHLSTIALVEHLNLQ